MRANQGSVRRAGGDVALAAVSIQVGFLGADLNVGNPEFAAWDFVLFCVFLVVWAGLTLCLKVERRCGRCSQRLEPSNLQAAFGLSVGYVSVLMAVILRLFVVPGLGG